MKRFVWTVLFAIVSAASVRADELDAFRQREQLLAQKWSRDVASAIDGAKRQSPSAARESLSNAMTAVKSAPGLSDAAKNDLIRRLQTSLSALPTVSAPVVAPRPTGFPSGATPLPSTFPGGAPQTGGDRGVADQAKAFIDRQNKNLSNSAEARDNRATGFQNIVSGTQSAPVLNDRDVALSPNHKEIVARRTPKLNPKEEAVMKALSSTVEANFNGMTFKQALDFLVQKTGLVIIPDLQSLREMNVEYDDPVNFSLNAKVTVRTVLRKILADRGLSYTISEGTVNVVTTQRAREATVTRIYPINDLVTPAVPTPQYIYNPYVGFIPVPTNALPPGTPGLTPTFNQQMGQAVAEMVRTSVDPQYWAPQGPGSVTFHEPTGSLIVRASAEIHWMVGGALYRR